FEIPLEAQNLFLEELITCCRDDESHGGHHDNVSALRHHISVSAATPDHSGIQENQSGSINGDVKYVDPITVEANRGKPTRFKKPLHPGALRLSVSGKKNQRAEPQREHGIAAAFRQQQDNIIQAMDDGSGPEEQHRRTLRK